MINATRLKQALEKVEQAKQERIKQGLTPDKPLIDRDYNCHGLTLWLLGHESSLKWVETDTFEQFLKIVKKQEAKKPERKKGELLVIAVDDHSNSHSAIYLGDGKYLHKKGSGQIEILEWPEVRKTYNYGKTLRLYI